MTKRIGRVIRSKDLTQEFVEKEMSRRAFVKRAALASAGGAVAGSLAGCPTGSPVDDDDTTEPEVQTHLVGLGSGDGYKEALEAAMAETIAADGLADVVSSGDVVYLKVNCNSGDWYPYSTRQRMIEEVGQWAWDQGASRVIVGDRSFYGYSAGQTLSIMDANGVAEATENMGGELIAFDTDDEWVQIEQTDANLWVDGFRFPRVVVEADVIINLPIMKTHFITGFTMAMKNIIGLCHPEDRARAGNLDYHANIHNKIAQLNQHVTPTLHLLDAYLAGDLAGARSLVDPLTGSAGVLGARASLLLAAAARVDGEGDYDAAAQALAAAADCSGAGCEPLVARARRGLAEVCAVSTAPACDQVQGPEDHDRALAASVVLLGDGHGSRARAALTLGLAAPTDAPPSCLQVASLRVWTADPGPLEESLRALLADAARRAARAPSDCALFQEGP